MKRAAFIFKIKLELKSEYKKAHDEIWPEMVEAIRKSGIKNYSIFFREDGTLFAYLESDNFEKANSQQKETVVYKKWQEHMEKYFVKKD
ncbi:MAG: L-rhamnose mutarotase [Actinobacteria bacterium]|nr:L-rhamnose mutarotase [Actinomycetota bacterium]